MPQISTLLQNNKNHNFKLDYELTHKINILYKQLEGFKVNTLGNSTERANHVTPKLKTIDTCKSNYVSNNIENNNNLKASDYKNMWRWIKNLIRFKGNDYLNNEEAKINQKKIDLVDKLMNDLRADNFYDLRDKILYKLKFYV